MADDLKLEYVGSLTDDNLGFGAYKQYKAMSRTLAVLRSGAQVKGVYIHCNSNIIVRRGTANVSKHYAVRREWRNWQADLDSANPDTRTGDYKSDTSALAIDSGEKPIGEWLDAPGVVLFFRQTKYERLLSEWVVGGDTSYDHSLVQGLGGLYFFVILDLTPTDYRFSMSPAYDLTVDQVRDALGGGDGLGPLPPNGPWKTEADVTDTQWVARHAAWQSFATLNAQLPLPTP